jgi:hypothetical protein
MRRLSMGVQEAAKAPRIQPTLSSHDSMLLGAGSAMAGEPGILAFGIGPPASSGVDPPWLIPGPRGLCSGG